MTPKEYLELVYRMDQKIKRDMAEVEYYEELSQSVRSPGFEEHFNPNKPEEATFLPIVDRLEEKKEELRADVLRAEELKTQIRTAIEAVPDERQQTVLLYRYFHHMSWTEIGERMFANERTVRRWHEKALQSVAMPENFISIENRPAKSATARRSPT